MKNMKVQAKLEIGNNHAKMFSKNYNVVNLFVRSITYKGILRNEILEINK